jgi:hypothetical protein
MLVAPLFRSNFRSAWSSVPSSGAPASQARRSGRAYKGRPALHAAVNDSSRGDLSTLAIFGHIATPVVLIVILVALAIFAR